MNLILFVCRPVVPLNHNWQSSHCLKTMDTFAHVGQAVVMYPRNMEHPAMWQSNAHKQGIDYE